MKNYLKSNSVLITLLFACQFSIAQNVGIGNGTVTPFPGAMLDVQSNQKGFLLPRLTTAERTAMTLLTKGLVVFDSTDNNFWFYTNQWNRLGGSAWWLNGNAGTNSATDFIGTTDANGLNFRTDNINRFQISNTGNLTILSDQNTLQFATATNFTNKPMMQMFQSGTANRDRMVIAHSPGYPSWGLEYRDTNDVFFLRNSSGRKFAFGLATGQMGIGVEDPQFPLDAVGRFKLRWDGNVNNSPGIWFTNLANTFDRVFLGMSKPDSGFGIFSQHLNKWGNRI